MSVRLEAGPIVQTCDEAGLDAAVAAGGSHTFDCLVPTTIITSGEKQVPNQGSLTLNGADLLTISGNDTHRVFSVGVGATLRLENIIFTEGLAAAGNGGAIHNEGTLELVDSTVSNSASATGNGGGIYSSGGNTSTLVEGSTISGNMANSAGGGLYVGSGGLTVTNSDFLNNTAMGNGGGIWNNSSIPLTITGSTFTGNNGGGGGGVWRAGGVSTAISNSTFTDNHGTHGGGLYVAAGTGVDIDDTDFIGNTATSDGGGAHIEDNFPTTVDGGTFSGNAAVLNGGGLYNDFNGTTTITGVTFTNNEASSGGGLYNEQTNTDVISSHFEGNVAVNGGGLYSELQQTTITGSTFFANMTTAAGAGIFCSDATVTVTDSEILNNVAQNSGGGMFCSSTSPLNISGTLISGNSGLNGGGIYRSGGGSTTISLSTIADNHASSVLLGGGGLFAGPGTGVDLDDTDFTGNSTDGDGGAAFVSGNLPLTVDGGSFSGNTAVLAGGGVYNHQNGIATITGVTFTANEAQSGGGIYNEQTNTDVISSHFEGNIATSGGGLYSDLQQTTINNSTFTANMTTSAGAGIRCSGAQVTVTDSEILDNIAVGNGGGMFCSSSSPLTVTGTLLSGNSGSNGGGIHRSGGGSTTISNSSFLNNQALSGNGGGGGLRATTGGGVDLDDTDFIGNSSADDGGGAYIFQNLPTTIDGGSFSGNTAARDGGGLYNRQNGNTTITGVSFTDNEADRGGGLNNDETPTTVVNSHFEGNDADNGGGGAIYNELRPVTISGTTITANTANNGGAIRNLTGEVILTDSLLTLNHTTTSAGAIRNDQNTSGLEITDSTISGNTTDGSAGGIYNAALGDNGPVVTGTTIDNNVAANDGGGILNRGNFTMENVTLSGNAAGGDGGAIVNRWTMVVSYTTFYGNTAGDDSGGVYTVFTSAMDPTNSEISNSVFAANSNGDCGGNGTFTPFNNFATGPCGSMTITGLSPTLQVNGGPTSTHALLAGGNAIDAAMADCPALDQRGVMRPVDGDGDMNADCDAGAFEFEPQAGIAPVITSFSGNPNPVAVGASVNLSWTTTDADGCWGSWTEIPLTPNDSDIVTVDATTQYMLTCANAVDFDEAMIIVEAIDPPEITSFSADPNPVPQGGLTTLSWTTFNADSCTGSWTMDALPVNGADDVIVEATTQYTINCVNAVTFDEAMVTVELLDPPEITSFSADPNPVAPGGQTTLSWTTMDADSCTGSWTMDALPVNGADDVVVDVTTQYTINCTNAAGFDEAMIIVEAINPPEITSFTADPNPVAPGGLTTLSWTTMDADSCTGSWTMDALPVNGADDVVVEATTQYTINCVNAVGFDEAMIIVEAIDPPVITSFTADPNPVPQGGLTTLSWTTINADSCAGSWNPMLPANGSDDVVVEAMTQYTINCVNAVGFDEAMVIVELLDPPEITSFSADPNPVAPGGQTTLSWTTTNAVSCAGSWDPMLPVNGSDDVVVDVTTQYTLNCTNAAGFDEAMVTVTVIDPPEITSFTADPDQVPLFGDPTTLSWTSTDADNCTGSWTLDALPPDGSDVVNVDSPPLFILTCHNAVGADEASVMVTVDELIDMDGFED